MFVTLVDVPKKYSDVQTERAENCGSRDPRILPAWKDGMNSSLALYWSCWNSLHSRNMFCRRKHRQLKIFDDQEVIDVEVCLNVR